VIYSLLVNNTECIDYLTGIDAVKESKDIDDRIFKPEFSLTFALDTWLQTDNSRSPFANIDFKDTPVLFYEITSGVYIIDGAISDIQVEGNQVKVIVSIPDRDKLNDKVKTSYVRYNIADIVKGLCTDFNIDVNDVYYKRIKEIYKNKEYSLVINPDESDLTFFEALNQLALKAGLQIYFTRNQIFIDELDPTNKDNYAFTLYDEDIFSENLSLNRYSDKLYTNFSFKCEAEGDVVLKDNQGLNIGYNARKKYGDKPYDEIDAGLDSNVRIYDAESGHFGLVNIIRFYGREFKIITIDIDVWDFSFLSLDVIFQWVSNKHNFDLLFEVRSIEKDYDKGTAKITAWEIKTNNNLTLTTGYGVTPYGYIYGE